MLYLGLYRPSPSATYPYLRIKPSASASVLIIPVRKNHYSDKTGISNNLETQINPSNFVWKLSAKGQMQNFLLKSFAGGGAGHKTVPALNAPHASLRCKAKNICLFTVWQFLD